MLLITGGSGFVGSHLTTALEKKKIDYVNYDLLEGNDIRDLCKLDTYFEKYQITEVIHLAALAGVRRGNEYPQDYISTNILGTYNIVKMCEKYNVDHLVFYSSSSVYGNSKPPIDESYTKKPISLYGTTKLSGERIVEASEIQQTTIVIPFTVYGPEGRKDEVIYKWLEQHKNHKPITVFGDGSSKRGYVYVKDLVDTTIKIIEEHRGDWKRETFNLGGSEVITLHDLVAIFIELIPKIQVDYMDMPKTDIKENFADTSKAGKKLSFYPEKRFEEVVKKIIKTELNN